MESPGPFAYMNDSWLSSEWERLWDCETVIVPYYEWEVSGSMVIVLLT